MNEFDIIKNCFAPLSVNETGAFRLTDDAAVLQVPQGCELVVTKDAMTAGIHFIGNEPAAMIAAKLLRVNLSDLAAMGAKPYAYFLALILPEKTDERWLLDFTSGLKNEQETFGITLMGGDTTHTKGPLSLSLTALGVVPQGQALRRNGAKAGDNIYVTGTIGDAALGLQVAQSNGQAEDAASQYLLERYRLPAPRVELGQALRGIANACIDISDGLLQDLGHITQCSATGALLNWDDIPLSEAASEKLLLNSGNRETILGGGDDYELLFTAAPEAETALQELSRKTSVNISKIGRINEGREVKTIDKNGNEIYVSKSGYNHFQAPYGHLHK